MKLYMKQKVFSWGDKFHICNGLGEPVYEVRGEVFSLGKKLHVMTPDGTEIAFIRQRLWSFLPKYEVTIGGEYAATVTRRFSLLKPHYTAEGPQWDVRGNFLAHEYMFADEAGNTVVSVAKQWLTWGDTYEIDIENEDSAVMALCVVLAIDAAVAQQNASASASN